MNRRVRITVRGRVQGVGFRYATARRATEIGVNGWVRNRSDGSVELVAEGASAAVDALIAWCGRGPGIARVAGVEVADDESSEALAGFQTRA